MQKFDIFAGSRQDPLWLEARNGLIHAIARMERRARTKPGRYFVYDAAERALSLRDAL